VASIEAEIDLNVDGKGNIIANDVNNVSAIALGNSEIETPGFAGATLLGQLQAFAKERGIVLTEKYEIRKKMAHCIPNTGRPEAIKLAEEI
jgi:hypothetical protein